MNERNHTHQLIHTYETAIFLKISFLEIQNKNPKNFMKCVPGETIGFFMSFKENSMKHRYLEIWLGKWEVFPDW